MSVVSSISKRPLQVAQGLKVAVLGSGIAGSTAARELAERGTQVTVFEVGFGIGGRTSTRITRDNDRYQFDHGAQYIGKPKTTEFGTALMIWEQGGYVKEWKGRFATVSDGVVTHDEPGKPHYVGYPGMHSICRNLLHHENIRVVTQTRACATHLENNNESGSFRWSIASHKNKKKALGEFDWLVASDRLSATDNRADLRNAPLPEFK